MRSECKKEYALRISQANNVEMIIISYEIINTYLQDALEISNDAFAYKNNLDYASRCIDELIVNLHFEYEIAKTLKQLYVYMKKRIRDAKYNEDEAALKEVMSMIDGLKQSYEKIKDSDTSESLMKNTQAVLVGMTYGKNKILDELSNDCVSRGYRV